MGMSHRSLSRIIQFFEKRHAALSAATPLTRGFRIQLTWRIKKMFFSPAKPSRMLIPLGAALLLITPATPADSVQKIIASPPSRDRHITLDPVVFTPAAPGQSVTKTVSGVIKHGIPPSTLPVGAPDWVYLPVDVPAGVNQIRSATRMTSRQSQRVRSATLWILVFSTNVDFSLVCQTGSVGGREARAQAFRLVRRKRRQVICLAPCPPAAGTSFSVLIQSRHKASTGRLTLR